MIVDEGPAPQAAVQCRERLLEVPPDLRGDLPILQVVNTLRSVDLVDKLCVQDETVEPAIAGGQPDRLEIAGRMQAHRQRLEPRLKRLAEQAAEPVTKRRAVAPRSRASLTQAPPKGTETLVFVAIADHSPC